MLARAVRYGGVVWVIGRILGMAAGAMIAGSVALPWIETESAFGVRRTDYGFDDPVRFFFVITGVWTLLVALGRPRLLATGRRGVLPVVALASVLASVIVRFGVLDEARRIERISIGNDQADLGSGPGFLLAGVTLAVIAAVMVQFRSGGSTSVGVPEQASATTGREAWMREQAKRRKEAGPHIPSSER